MLHQRVALWAATELINFPTNTKGVPIIDHRDATWTHSPRCSEYVAAPLLFAFHLISLPLSVNSSRHIKWNSRAQLFIVWRGDFCVSSRANKLILAAAQLPRYSANYESMKKPVLHSLPLFLLPELRYCYVSQLRVYVRLCASLHLPYFSTPLPWQPISSIAIVTAPVLPPVWLLSSSWKSALIEPKWNNWSPAAPPSHPQLLMKVAELIMLCDTFCQMRIFLDFISHFREQTSLYPVSSGVTELLMVSIVSLVSLHRHSWFCKGDLIEGEDLSSGCIVCLIASVKRQSISRSSWNGNYRLPCVHPRSW